MIRSSHHKPVYREVVAHAMRVAWNDRRYWILAILAGFLATAGSYDMLWSAVTSITSQGPLLALSAGGALVRGLVETQTAGLDRFLVVASGIEMLVFLAMFFLVLAVASCVAQGGLVFALGARKRGERPTVAEAFRMGARALWPTIVLNVMALSLLWVLRFLIVLPLYLALDQAMGAMYLVYLASFVVFIPLALMVAVMHVFSLNAVILQGAPLADAVRRSYGLIVRNWLVILETAALQVVLSIGVWILFVVGALFAMIPVFVVVFMSMFLQSVPLFSLGILVAAILFALGGIMAGAFTVQLQYATWTYLYRRLGEGGVLPKLHRLFRSTTGFFRMAK